MIFSWITDNTSFVTSCMSVWYDENDSKIVHCLSYCWTEQPLFQNKTHLSFRKTLCFKMRKSLIFKNSKVIFNFLHLCAKIVIAFILFKTIEILVKLRRLKLIYLVNIAFWRYFLAKFINETFLLTFKHE